MGNRFGKCALCGKECELTFEHIPPRSAFNSTPAKPVSGEKMVEDNGRMPWDTSGLRYSNQQKGMGKYSLCQECNNNTGTWYGNDYKTVARIVQCTISGPIDPKYNGIKIPDIYPLRFIKQVLSMFCSVNNNYDNPRLEELRKFVLDKDAVGLDKSKYKLCMYFTRSTMMKYAAISVLLRKTVTGIEAMALSEITAAPLGFILYFDPTDTWNYEGIDITHFTDCKYDDLAEIVVPLCIKEVNDFFPTFYRSKEEIKQGVEENKKWREEHDG